MGKKRTRKEAHTDKSAHEKKTYKDKYALGKKRTCTGSKIQHEK